MADQIEKNSCDSKVEKPILVIEKKNWLRKQILFVVGFAAISILFFLIIPAWAKSIKIDLPFIIHNIHNAIIHWRGTIFYFFVFVFAVIANINYCKIVAFQGHFIWYSNPLKRNTFRSFNYDEIKEIDARFLRGKGTNYVLIVSFKDPEKKKKNIRHEFSVKELVGFFHLLLSKGITVTIFNIEKSNIPEEMRQYQDQSH